MIKIYLSLLIGLILISIMGCNEDSRDKEKSEYQMHVQVGPRPYFLVEHLEEGTLKDELMQCSEGPFYPSDFSIGHRGAPLQFPEHTKESYVAAARMGAGIIECDVTFTKDKVLVCRHSQCDLHTTTNILSIPELAAKCTDTFHPADPLSGTKATAKCCTSDITLAEFKQLSGKMDGYNAEAITVEGYLAGTPNWRTDAYSTTGTLLTHAESIALFKQLQVKMIPELKQPMVSMPFDGFSQKDFASKLVDEYKQAGVLPENVLLQSFNLEDIEYWLENEPEYNQSTVFLDDRDMNPEFDIMSAETWQPSMKELADKGIKTLAPPLWMLVRLDNDNKIVPSNYAIQAKNAGLEIIPWSFERSFPLSDGGGWYYKTISQVITTQSDKLVLLDVLVNDVGIKGLFSDWPGTVTYYANCMGL